MFVPFLKASPQSSLSVVLLQGKPSSLDQAMVALWRRILPEGTALERTGRHMQLHLFVLAC